VLFVAGIGNSMMVWWEQASAMTFGCLICKCVFHLVEIGVHPARPNRDDFNIETSTNCMNGIGSSQMMVSTKMWLCSASDSQEQARKTKHNHNNA
jgi:hypothetical protein